LGAHRGVREEETDRTCLRMRVREVKVSVAVAMFWDDAGQTSECLEELELR
jgi:hypothetical protein